MNKEANKLNGYKIHDCAIMEKSPILIFNLSIDKKIIYLNPYFETLTGFKCNDWLGKPFTDLIHPENLGSFKNTLNYILDDNVASKYELKIKSKSNKYIICEVFNAPYSDNRKIVGIFGMACDITKRKQIEEILKQSENMYKTIFENTGTATAVCNEDGIIFLANTECEKLSGYTKSDVIGKEKWTKFIHKDDLPLLLKYNEMRKKDPVSAPRNYEFRSVDKEGKIKNLFITVAMIPGTKKMVFSLLDITKQKTAEESLKNAYIKLKMREYDLVQSEKLAALGRFSAGIAHEIRNPLGNITSASQFCLSKYKLPNIVKKHLEIILKNSENANRIIKELLDFAKPREFKFRMGNINNAINSTCDLVKTRCLKQHVVISRELCKNPPKVLFDNERLEEIFLNIILNAIEAMPYGGKLDVVSSEQKKGDYFVISFSDTGCGIPKENLNKIFEPFFTTKDDGSGLGLCLVHQIIDFHKGKISIDSKVGRGTKAIIKLPVAHSK